MMNKHTRLLGSVLARIFRDGGHAQQAVGDDNAARLADELIVHYRTALNAIEQSNRILERVGMRVSVCYKSDHQHRVEESMRKGEQPVRTSPEMPPPKERIRVVRIVIEEGLELAKAMGIEVSGRTLGNSVFFLTSTNEEDIDLSYSDAGQDKTDLNEAARTLAGVSAVTRAGFGALGIADQSLLELIDKNNLSKFDPPTCLDCGAVMEKTLVTLRMKDDDPSLAAVNIQGGEVGKMILWVCPTGGKEHQVREEQEGPWIREDGKYMKPPYWQPPDVKGLLEAQKAEAESWAKEDLDFRSDAVEAKGPDKLEWETESTPVKAIDGETGLMESEMTADERDAYASRLKLRFWRNLPWPERIAAIQGTLGMGKLSPPGQPIPQTTEIQLIRKIRDDGLLSTFEREIEMAEQRVALAGDYSTLCDRFWKLTSQARMVFWRTQVGVPVPPIKGQYPTGVQAKMLEAYKLEPERSTLRAYLDRVSPVAQKAKSEPTS